MIEELDLKHIFSSVKEEIATENFEKRSKLRIAEGKSKAKEWIQCDSCKFGDVIAAIKIYKPKTISKQVYTFPLNPWYYMTDLGYVYRLCQWDKLPTKEEKAKNENTLKWQLCCDGKAKQHQIYISKDKISIAKSLGYKVHTQIDKKKIKHHSIKINADLMMQCCFNEDKKMLPFTDGRNNKHSCKQFNIIDEDGNESNFESMKQCYETMFKEVCSWATFRRGINKEKTVLKIKNQSFIIIS